MSDQDRESVLQSVHNLFIWFNAISGTDKEVTMEDVARLYTEDATMVFNNRLICKGIEGNYLHCLDLKNQLKSWKFSVPFNITVVEGNTVAGYYTNEFTTLDGKRGTAYDMCIWTVRDGKIASITEVVVHEGADVILEEYK